MKKASLILAGLMISLISVKGQTPFISCTVDFENQSFSCWAGFFSLDNNPSAGNIWQVCNPNKPVFDSAYSPIHAIMTDSTGPYPVNDTSGFILKAISYSSDDVPFIGGWYKFDSDSLKDFGRIELSYDHGVTWQDILADSSIYWDTPKPVFTGRIYQWREFLGLLPFPSTIDTMYYRFTFISDNIQTNQQGWMLDDIYLLDHIEGIHNHFPDNEVSIFPNPVTDHITISASSIPTNSQLSILTMNGQQLITCKISQPETQLDISTLPGGVYIVKLTNDRTVIIRKFIKQ
jgi:hypothetical protein